MRYLSMLFLVVFMSCIVNAKEIQPLPAWMVGEWTVKGIYIEENSVDLFSPNYIPYEYYKDTKFIADSYKFRLAERGCSKFSFKENSVYIKNYLKKSSRETNNFVDSENGHLPKIIVDSKTIEARVICKENLTGRKNDPELTVSSAITFPLDWEFVKLGDDIGIKDYPCADCFFIFQRAPSEKTS